MIKFIYFAFALFVISIRVSPIFAYSGDPQAGRTGSPDDGFRTRNDTECHNTFSINSGTSTFEISAPSNYKLGEAVKINMAIELTPLILA